MLGGNSAQWERWGPGPGCQRSCGCTIPGGAQGQAGGPYPCQGMEQGGLQAPSQTKLFYHSTPVHPLSIRLDRAHVHHPGVTFWQRPTLHEKPQDARVTTSVEMVAPASSRSFQVRDRYCRLWEVNSLNAKHMYVHMYVRIYMCVKKSLLIKTKMILIIDYWFCFYHFILDHTEIPRT